MQRNRREQPQIGPKRQSRGIGLGQGRAHRVPSRWRVNGARQAMKCTLVDRNHAEKRGQRARTVVKVGNTSLGGGHCTRGLAAGVWSNMLGQLYPKMLQSGRFVNSGVRRFGRRFWDSAVEWLGMRGHDCVFHCDATAVGWSARVARPALMATSSSLDSRCLCAACGPFAQGIIQGDGRVSS